MAADPNPKRVLVFGASGTIGQACVSELVNSGHEVICFCRPQSAPAITTPDAEIRTGDVTDALSISRDAFCGQTFDVVLSCIASRTGAYDDAWAVDYQANADILKAAQSSGVQQMILLSAICVQRPELPFQRAKLAFEKELIQSDLTYSIIRPTAFFKSLSGQVERVRCGKPFLLFGDGELTSCKPISDQDLAWFIADCIQDSTKQNTILPIGGPGPAITPKQQAQMLFNLTGQQERYRKVPVGLFNMIVGLLSAAGRISSKARAKAQYAKIGRYYATESMLVYNQKTARYDADATPESGTETLHDHYRRLIGIPSDQNH